MALKSLICTFMKIMFQYHLINITQNVLVIVFHEMLICSNEDGLEQSVNLGVYVLPVAGMLVHCRQPCCTVPGCPNRSASNHLCSWVESGTVRVKHFTQEHIITFLAPSTPTHTAQSRVQGAYPFVGCHAPPPPPLLEKEVEGYI